MVKVQLRDVSNGWNFPSHLIDEEGIVYGKASGKPLKWQEKGTSRWIQINDENQKKRTINEKYIKRIKEESFAYVNEEKPKEISPKVIPTCDSDLAIQASNIIREHDYIKLRAQAMALIDNFSHEAIYELEAEAMEYVNSTFNRISMDDAMVDIMTNRLMVKEECLHVKFDKSVATQPNVNVIVSTTFGQERPSYYVPVLAEHWATEIRAKYWDKIRYKTGRIELRDYPGISINSNDLIQVTSVYKILIDFYGEVII